MEGWPISAAPNAADSKGITMLGKRYLELDRKKPRSSSTKADRERPYSIAGTGEAFRKQKIVRRGDEVVAQVKELNSNNLTIQATIGGLELSGIIHEVRPGQSTAGSSQAPASKADEVLLQPSVIVIGAGFAGLSAAQELHALGCKVTVVEARDRVGGRCWTEDLQGRVVDLGAGWIHGVEGNPLAEIVRQNGAQMHELPSDTIIHGPDGQPVPKHEDEAVEQLFNLLLQKAQEEARNDEVDDESLGHKLDKLLHNEGGLKSTLQGQIFQWHCANIEYSTATDIHNLSVRNWAVDDEHAFEGKHCLIAQGYGTLAKALAKGIDVRLGCEVTKIQHSHVVTDMSKVTLADGRELSADVVLVTLPLGVLKSRAVTFDPPLPKRKQDAIERMGFGLLNKIVLGFDENFWQASTPTGKYIGYAADRKGEFYMFVDISECAGKPTLMALVSGSVARALEAQSDDEVKSEVLKVVQKITGVSAVPEPCSFCITRWGMDRFAQGSYSYVSVGCSTDDMDALALPLESDKVFFAGEATTSEYPSTVHGAFTSGRRAARDILLAWHGDPAFDKAYDAFGPSLAATGEGKAPVCGLCGSDSVVGIEGNLIGPFLLPGPGVRKNGEDGIRGSQAYAHEQCALCSPEVGRDRKGYYNIAKAVRRGRMLKCTYCRKAGATIGCQVRSCRVTMHFRCCAATGWSFLKPSEGKFFYCPEHRRSGKGLANPRGATEASLAAGTAEDEDKGSGINGEAAVADVSVGGDVDVEMRADADAEGPFSAAGACGEAAVEAAGK